MKTLVIGYGNTLRGDDAIGVLTVDLLNESNLQDDVDLITCQQLTPELAEELAYVDRAAFIDASVPGDMPPGTISQVKLVPQPVDPAAIAHGFDACGLLALTEMLYSHTPEAVLFTVSAAQFDLTESLSPQVNSALPLLVKQVTNWILSASH
jgi:hydrogenase maturation protease